MITDLDDVITFVGDGEDREVVGSCHKAAETYIAARCRWNVGPDGEIDDNLDAPEDLVQAVKFQTARYLARRRSPDGMLEMGEFGPARVPITDRDVQDLIGPYRRVVV